MILVRNLVGTPGTPAEKAIYGLECLNDRILCHYSETTRDYRDTNVKVNTVTYTIEEAASYIGSKKWSIVM